MAHPMRLRPTLYSLAALIAGWTWFAEPAAAQSSTSTETEVEDDDTPAAPTPAPRPAPAPAARPHGYPPPPYGYPPPPYGYPPPPYGYPPPPYAYPPPPYAYPPPPGYGEPARPIELKYKKGEPIPPGYRLVKRRRTGLAVAGGVLFGSSYLATILIGSIFLNESHSPAVVFIPVVGPFIESGILLNRDSSDGEAIGGAFCIVDGLVQAGGIAMFIAGLASHRKVLVREDVPAVSVHLTPRVLGTRGGGVWMTGVF